MSATTKKPAAKKPKTAKAPAVPKTLIAYKGFDKDLVCHPSSGQRFQYAVGETYTHDGPVTRCGAGGFHSCEYPLDVFGYYAPAGSRFAIVEVGGELDRANDDTKIASSVLKVKAELSLEGIIKAAVEYITSRANPAKGSSATGYQSAATNTGNWSAATNTGNQSAATNTGDQSAATNTGDRSAATNTGDQSAATNTGNWSAATNTGNQSAATNTGNHSAASVTGNNSAAMASGYAGKVMGKAGCALFLVERNDDYEIIAVWAGIAGRDGIKAETWYALSGGKPVEVAA
jgi:hypothetical protein